MYLYNIFYSLYLLNPLIIAHERIRQSILINICHNTKSLIYRKALQLIEKHKRSKNIYKICVGNIINKLNTTQHNSSQYQKKWHLSIKQYMAEI